MYKKLRSESELPSLVSRYMSFGLACAALMLVMPRIRAHNSRLPIDGGRRIMRAVNNLLKLVIAVA